MNFFGALGTNKVKIISVVGMAMTGLLLLVFIKKSKEEQTREESLERQIELLRKQINVRNPSYQDFKRVMALGIREAKLSLNDFKQVFRQRRQKFTKNNREQQMQSYLECTYAGIAEMDAIATQKLLQIGKKIGFRQDLYKRYENQVSNSIKDILEGQSQITADKCLTVEQTKQWINKRKDFIRRNGAKYIEMIITATRKWSGSKRSALQVMLPIIIADAALEEEPDLNVDLVFESQTKHENVLIGQLQQLEFAMTPLMLKINAAIHSATGKDLADFNMASQGDVMQELSELQNLQMDSYTQMSQMISESTK